MTKEEVIAAVQECAAKLGHAPSLGEFRKMSQISKSRIRQSFGTFTQLLTASGLEVQGPGHMVEMKDLFMDCGTEDNMNPNPLRWTTMEICMSTLERLPTPARKRIG